MITEIYTNDTKIDSFCNIATHFGINIYWASFLYGKKVARYIKNQIEKLDIRYTSDHKILIPESISQIYNIRSFLYHKEGIYETIIKK